MAAVHAVAPLVQKPLQGHQARDLGDVVREQCCVQLLLVPLGRA